MWNVTCYADYQDGIKSRIDDGTARVLEAAYRAVLERYGQVALLAQQDETAGLDEGVSHFEQGQSAWAFICAEAYEAAMNRIAYSLLAEFDAVWIDE